MPEAKATSRLAGDETVLVSWELLKGLWLRDTAKGRTAIVFLSNMSIVHDLWRTSNGPVKYFSWSMERLHKTTLPTGWVLWTQSKIEKETQAVLWNKLTKKNNGNSMRPTVNKMHSIKFFQSGPPPYMEIPYFQPSISRKGLTTSPSTKLVLKYMELR